MEKIIFKLHVLREQTIISNVCAYMREEGTTGLGCNALQQGVNLMLCSEATVLSLSLRLCSGFLLLLLSDLIKLKEADHL